MPHKHPAKSAAAATASAAPTFTSFAAATAAALPTFAAGDPNLSSALEPTAWDSDALALLKKLSKRDPTTKLRALSDLTLHLSSFPSSTPDAGAAFLAAFPPAFSPVVLDDPSPAVRAAILSVLPPLISTLGRAVQPALPTLLPPWVAATADLAKPVAAEAKSTLARAIPSERRQKAATKLAAPLRLYVTDVLTRLRRPSQGGSSTSFRIDARRALAILSWILQSTKDVSSIAPIIDDAADPLRFLARPPAAVRPDAPVREVTDLAIALVSRMEQTPDERTIMRAERLVALSLLLARHAHASAWTLILNLLRGFPGVFGSDFGVLPDTLSKALMPPRGAPTQPAAFHALVPLFDALPAEARSASFATSVLDSLCVGLGLSEAAKVPSVQYELVALPAFVDALAFVITCVSDRWLAESDRTIFRADLLSRHVGPVVTRFMAGALPRLPTRATADSDEAVCTTSAAPASRRRAAASNEAAREREREFIEGVARLMRQLSDAEAKSFAVSVGEAVLEGLCERELDAVCGRVIALVSQLGEAEREAGILTELLLHLGSAVTDAEQNDTAKLDLADIASLVSGLLEGRGAAAVVHTDGEFGRNGCIRIVADMAVVLLKTYAGNEDSDQREQCSVKHLGSVCSWVLWATISSGVHDGWNALLDSLDNLPSLTEKFQVLAAIVAKHKARRESDHFKPCEPLKGGYIEDVVVQAARHVQTKKDSENCTKAALSLLTAATHVAGGAVLSPEVFTTVTEATVALVHTDEHPEELDNLVVSLLNSPILHIIPEAIVDELTSASILRASKNDYVLNELLDGLARLPVPAVQKSALSMGSKVKESIANGTSTSTSSLALAKIVTALGERDVQASASVSEQVLSWSPLNFTIEFLRETPLSSIFGDGSQVDVNADLLVSVFDVVATNMSSDFQDKLKTYLCSLETAATSKISIALTNRAFSEPNADLQNVLRSLLHCWSSNSLHMKRACEEMSEKMKEVVKLVSRQTTPEFSRLPNFVSVLVNESLSSCLDYLESLLKDVVVVIRRDPSSPAALTGLDILSAALSEWATSLSSERDTRNKLASKWLEENIVQALRSVRRTFEQPRGLSKSSLSLLEAHAALLMAYTLNVFGKETDVQDDERFWLIRCKDSLEGFVRKNVDKNDTLNSNSVKNMVNLSKLGVALVEDDNEHSRAIDIQEEICHWGAWAATFVLPSVDDESINDARTGWNGISAESCAKLVLEAAKRGVLLRGDGTIPVNRERVYGLIPLLGNSSESVRNAVLTLLAFFSAVDMPTVVEASFPKKPFADEAGEMDFAMSMLPSELRTALVWTGSADSNEEETVLRELGYLLAWRVFLDMIRLDGAGAGSAGGDGGEISVRRVGVTFLRGHSELFAEFFNQVTDVVVDGSTIERAAATRAAADAVRMEESGSEQGIQLAQTTVKMKEERVIHGGESLEEAVGRAAGVAFARALQRLPAMSRQHVRDSVDRGKIGRVESFARRVVSPLLIAAAVRRAQDVGMFGEGNAAGSSEETGSVATRGSVGGREVRATYTFSDVTLEMALRLPETFPLQAVVVEAGARKGMSEGRWRKTVLGMTTTLQMRDGTLGEAVELWRRNLDKTFQGAEECPICYSVLHLATAALPQMQCRTCKNSFHSDCLCKWFTKSNSSACPLCRSAF